MGNPSLLCSVSNVLKYRLIFGQNKNRNKIKKLDLKANFIINHATVQMSMNAVKLKNDSLFSPSVAFLFLAMVYCPFRIINTTKAIPINSIMIFSFSVV